MRTLILITLFFLSNFTGFSCINEYVTRLDGTVSVGQKDGIVYSRDLDTIELRMESAQLWEKYLQTNSLQLLSDYAAKLVYLGEYEKAKGIYFDIEKTDPNLYTTASNLGTIYELIDQPDSALFWIKKSIELNPQSHNGSEWIHIKILEFKLYGNEDYSSSILGLNFGNGNIPENIDQLDLIPIHHHIHHQLTERLKFVQPENKIVGNIYFDYGNTSAILFNVQRALGSYSEAIRFGFYSKIMTSRIKYFIPLTFNANQSTNVKVFIKKNSKLIFILGIVFLISLPFLFVWLFSVLKKKRNI